LIAFDGNHLRAARKTLAAVSKARNIPERVDFGCGYSCPHISLYNHLPRFIASLTTKYLGFLHFKGLSLASLAFAIFLPSWLRRYGVMLFLAFHKVLFCGVSCRSPFFEALDWIAGSRSTLWTTHWSRIFLLLSRLISHRSSWRIDLCHSSRTWFIAISSKRNGSKSFWLCPDIIIGTILLKKRASTRTLLFISVIDKLLELTTIR